MEKKTYTVHEINRYLEKKINRDKELKNIWIKGEISNFTDKYKHLYFTLKDKNSEIPAVMFETYRSRFLKIPLKDGMNVRIKGKIEVYVKSGKYQLNAIRIEEDGLGELYRAYEKLKKKLKEEELFDESHKKEIPKYPKRIGVVTAPSGAAIEDIITTIERKWPLCEIIIFPTLVQGSQAAPQIVRQIRKSQNYDIDTLIVGRGGGSIEDLWPFNEEIVAREIYACRIPVISAVGHEVDWTISDHVADLRAPTPTAAGDLAVPEFKNTKYKVRQLEKQCNTSIRNKITLNKTKLENLSKNNMLKNPETIYEMKGMHLDRLLSKLEFGSKNLITKNKSRLIRLESSSIFKNPENIYGSKEMRLNNLVNKLEFKSKDLLSINRNKLVRLKSSPIFKNPQEMYKSKENELDKIINNLTYASTDIIRENKTRLFRLENSGILKNPQDITKNKRNECLKNIHKLEVLNPLLTLKRGYSIAKVDDKVISSSKDVEVGDEVDIEFDDGIVNTKVI